jgi:hypothetical protein
MMIMKLKTSERSVPAAALPSLGFVPATDADRRGAFEDLLDAVPALRKLDDACERLGRGQVPCFDLLAELARLVGPATKAPSWAGTQAAYDCALWNLAMTTFEALPNHRPSRRGLQ